MLTKINLESLSVNSVTVQTTVGEELPHAKAYVNSPSGRTVLANEVPEPYLSTILETWGSAPTLEDESMSREDILNSKFLALSSACNQTIYAGADVVLSSGTTAHFTYDIFDQANISEMFSAVVLGATEYPYQAAGGSCRVYSAGDIIIIYATLAGLKTATLTYYHQIKDYLKTLKTVAEIQSVTWGQALEGEYLTHYNETIAAAQAQLQIMLAKLGA